MYSKTYQATHPDMMHGVSNEALRDRYLVSGMFVADQINLNYSHNERMIVGGAAPVTAAVALPDQTEPVAGAPFLDRRELGVVNVGGGSGKVSVDGETFDMKPRDGLYTPMGSKAVSFESDSKDEPARYYLASTPAHAATVATGIRMKGAGPFRTTTPARRPTAASTHPTRVRRRAFLPAKGRRSASMERA